MDRHDVSEAFRWLLGRSLERGLAIDDLLALEEAELRDRILRSSEFKQYYLSKYLALYKFVFIRIPKTATTSLVAALKKTGMSTTDIDGAIPGLSQVFDRHSLITGHFTFRDVLAKLDGFNPVFISILRDPRARIISLYCQVLRESGHPCHREIQSRSLYEALQYEGLFYEWAYNAQSRFVSGRHLFSDVSEVLNSHLVMIAGEHSAGQLLLNVCKMAGLPLVGIPRLNASEKDQVRSVLSQADFSDAERAIHWLTVEDQKLCKFVGDFFVSPPLQEMLRSQNIG